jgi:hypothetical protein
MGAKGALGRPKPPPPPPAETDPAILAALLSF